MGALTLQQRLNRLEVRLAELAHWRGRAHLPIRDWRFDDAPLRLGQPWPDRSGVHHLSHPEIVIPASWPLEETILELDLGGESLLRVDYPDGANECFGVDPSHTRLPLRDRRFSLAAEAVARLPFGTPSPDARLSVARLVWLESAVERLYRLLRMVLEAARALEAHEVVTPLVACAERALAGLDWPTATGTYLDRIGESAQMRSLWALPRELDPHPRALAAAERESVTGAAERLEDELRRLQQRYPKQGAVALAGHAHIDLAWLWPLEETRRKARRTFWTAVELLDRHDDFRFTQSSAQLYELVEADDPELFERIREKVAAGAWEPIGGMWVESDANMPCGESLVRQLLYGQRYFAEKFGFTHTVCWLPDCFGFTPALPQLLLGAGIENFLTIKLTWSETNRFPHDLFWWEGLDGSRVLAHLFDNPLALFTEGQRVGSFGFDGPVVMFTPAGLVAHGSAGFLGGYNGDTGPLSVLATWRNYRGKHVSPETLLSVGWGDGGGGPTEEMIEQAHDAALLPAVPEIRFTRVADFYERARRTIGASAIPTWTGELYLEFHRGTLTTQGRVKRLHRQVEHDLVAAEVVTALDALLGGEAPASLAAQWKFLLRNEFHDILPGSSIREVNELAEAELEDVSRAARRTLDERLDALARRLVASGDAEGLLAVNPHLSPQPLRVELEREVRGAQRVEDGYVVTGADELAGLEARVIVSPAPAEAVRVSDDELENEFVKVTLSSDGTLASVYDKAADREVLDGPGNQLWVYVDKPRLFDAWDIDSDYADESRDIGPAESVEVLERGPHRGAIRLSWRYRDSQIRQDVRLWSNSARLEFRTRLTWHDRRLLVKARFPLAVRAPSASFETAFGVVERPTHRNTSWDAARFEVAAHRFADLSEPGYGAALLNDGRYGHHAVGNELGISLLRSPAYPDPLADEGEQTFTYALYPHRGRGLAGGVLGEAQDLNRPLLARAVATARAASWRPLRLDGLELALATVKALEEGDGLVLRTYEPQGSRGRARPSLAPGWAIDAELNLLEEEIGPPDLTFRPFQVHSWRLRRSSQAARA
jgi:alpha-mannosidase